MEFVTLHTVVSGFWGLRGRGKERALSERAGFCLKFGSRAAHHTATGKCSYVGVAMTLPVHYLFMVM